MKKLSNLLIIVLSLSYVAVCVIYPDVEVFTSSTSFGSQPNMFGLFIGGILCLSILRSLFTNASEGNYLGYSVFLVIISVVNIMAGFFGFTTNSSSMLSDDVAAVESMYGIGSVTTELLEGAYIPLVISIILFGVCFYRSRKN